MRSDLVDRIKDVLKPIVSRLPGRNNEATRAKWIECTLQEIPKGSRILDAGCGEQQFRKFCSHLVVLDKIRLSKPSSPIYHSAGEMRTAMLVNGLRSTPLTELYIVFRKTAQMLDAAVFLADVDGGTAA
jgi:hypothetical protein